MSTQKSRSFRRPAYKLGLVALTVAFAVPLVAYALIGLNMRYSGDDYCYAGLFRQEGFLRTITDTYRGPSPFHGNRVSLTISSGIADSVGPAANAILPGLVLVLWLGGLVLLFRGIAAAAGITLKVAEPILAGEALMLATLLITPQLVQSLYWRSGMFPYLMPLVSYPYIAALIIRQARGSRASMLSLTGIFLLSLVAGAYSETAAAVQITLLLLAAGTVIVISRINDRSLKRVPVALGTSFVGTMLAIVILAVSPANESRLATLDQAANLAELIRLAAYHGYLYSRSVLPRQLVPLLAPFLISFWLSAKIMRRTGRRLVISWREALFGLVYITVAAIAVVFATMLPSAYAQSSYPVGRALILAAFAVAFAGAVAGAILGSFLEAKPREFEKTALRVAGVSVAIVGIYALAGTISTLNDLTRYQRWARFWDERHSQILSERRAGDGKIEVVLIDHIIPDVAELQPDPDFFYNNCAEWYYDIQQLAANQPGWDE